MLGALGVMEAGELRVPLSASRRAGSQSKGLRARRQGSEGGRVDAQLRRSAASHHLSLFCWAHEGRRRPPWDGCPHALWTQTLVSFKMHLEIGSQRSGRP